MRSVVFIASFAVAALFAGQGWAEVKIPAAIDAPGETAAVTFHAIGEQIYECKADDKGKLAWAGREPIAALMIDGKTVGRHYAGPSWEDNDGSKITAKAAGNAPGKSKKDVAWLKLEVTGHAGSDGRLTPITTVQRINTQGGNLTGSCKKAGDIQSAPYTADYVMLRKGS